MRAALFMRAVFSRHLHCRGIACCRLFEHRGNQLFKILP